MCIYKLTKILNIATDKIINNAKSILCFGLRCQYYLNNYIVICCAMLYLKNSVNICKIDRTSREMSVLV